MRQYLNLVTESDNAVDQAMNQIGDYIRHNAHTDLISAANVLKSAGYSEPFGAGTYTARSSTISPSRTANSS